MNFLDSCRTKIAAKKMSAHGLFPKFNEIIPTGFGFFSTLYDHEVSSIISEDVSTGFGKTPEAALIRSLSEYVERTAFRDGKARGEQSCLTQRSDGLAAFPKILSTSKHSYFCARRNAFNEAVERFSWATWWDNPEISHRICDAKFLKKFWALSDIAIAEVPFHEKVIDLKIVIPSVQREDVTLIIMVAFTADGGAISGGAAGGPTPVEMKSTITRATSELFRHALALKRMKNTGIRAKSFYQKRLEFFGLNKGGDQVRDRLAYSGKNHVSLPNLSTDCSIPHSLEDIFHVHRCYFENQPPFIGGELQRFCI